MANTGENCKELLKYLDELIEDENRAIKEYMELLHKLIQVSPELTNEFAEMVIKIRMDESRHGMELTVLKNKAMKVCGV